MKKLMIAMAAMGLSSVAMAGPSWTYIDGSYAAGSSFGDTEVDGYALSGSFGFAGIWHIAGTYGVVDADNPGAAGGLDQIDSYYEIRGGVHPAITDSTDFVAELGYISWDLDATDLTPTAYELTVGVRSMVADNLELNAFLTSQTGDTDGAVVTTGNDDFRNLVPSVGGQYFFTDNLSVNASYSWGNTEGLVVGSGDLAEFGVRWSF